MMVTDGFPDVIRGIPHNQSMSDYMPDMNKDGTIVLRTIIQPCGGMGTEIKSGTEKTLILAGLTKLADIKGGELGMGTVLNNQRFTLIINNFRAICLEN